MILVDEIRPPVLVAMLAAKMVSLAKRPVMVVETGLIEEAIKDWTVD
jgi:CO dehydrogenase/acetyl-CoA synthase epsilon subunit